MYIGKRASPPLCFASSFSEMYGMDELLTEGSALIAVFLRVMDIPLFEAMTSCMHMKTESVTAHPRSITIVVCR